MDNNGVAFFTGFVFGLMLVSILVQFEKDSTLRLVSEEWKCTEADFVHDLPACTKFERILK